MNLEVIIIDDDKVLRKVLEKIIQICGLAQEPLQFENGAEALTYFESKDFDPNKKSLVFLDINMPLMDGWEFLEATRKKGLLDNTELFLLTSSIDVLDHERGKKHPFVIDVLVKPLTIEKLKTLKLLNLST